MEQINLRVTRDADNLRVRANWSRAYRSEAEIEYSASVAGIPDAAAIVPTAKNLEDIGAKLFSSVISKELEQIYQVLLRGAREGNGILSISLALDAASSTLPWELLYDRQNPVGFIALDYSQSILRRLDSDFPTSPIKSYPASLPIRILHIVAPARDYETFSPTNLPKALSLLLNRKLILVDELNGNDTHEALHEASQKAIEENHPYHILHFEGHGEISNGIGHVIFCDQHGRGIPVKSDELASTLSGFSDIRLAVFNCCMSGGTSARFAYGSVAQALAASGIPFVIGMNGHILDESANLFMRFLLENLIRTQHSIFVGIPRARRAMISRRGVDQSQFYYPGLFTMIDPSGVTPEFLFDASRVNTQILNLGCSQEIQVTVPVPKEIPVTVTVLPRSIRWAEEGLEIEIEATLLLDEAKYEVNLAATPPIFLVAGTRFQCVQTDALLVNNQRKQKRTLTFKGDLEYPSARGTLVFNQDHAEQDRTAPRVVVPDIPIPLKKSKSDHIRRRTLPTYSSAQWNNIIAKCPNEASFVRYCLSNKESWLIVEGWYAEGLIALWAEDHLCDLDLSEHIHILNSTEYQTHLKLWLILKYLDPSLTLPVVHVETDRKDGAIEFHGFDLLSNTPKSFCLWVESSPILVGGFVGSRAEWLRVGSNEWQVFNLHPQDARTSFEVSVNPIPFFRSRSKNLLRRIMRRPVDNSLIRVQVLFESGYRNPQRLECTIPIIIVLQPWRVVIALVVVLSAVTLTWLLTYTSMAYRTGAIIGASIATAFVLMLAGVFFLLVLKTIERRGTEMQTSQASEKA